MRAVLINNPGEAPTLGEFREPAAQDGAVLINVETAALGGWDGYALTRPHAAYPLVLMGEGVGRTEDGRRVYFGERSVAPFGAWAERTIVPIAEVWDVPHHVDDRTAITMAIAGTGSYVPLQEANINKGDSVLVLGATGVLGQLALQYARIMGAGRLVAAGRSEAPLARLLERRITDATVRTGTPDDVAALKDAAGEGFDVVFDPICGPTLLAALKATRMGARIVTVGVIPGQSTMLKLDIRDLSSRTYGTIGTGWRPAAFRESVWRRLLELVREHDITVDYADYTLDQFPEAWARQIAGPHAKITTKIGGPKS
jgi:NADPH:quinone reductase-like Zn-dependent oxidoreductase